MPATLTYPTASHAHNTIPATCPFCGEQDSLFTAVDNITLYNGNHYQFNGTISSVTDQANPEDADIRIYCSCCGGCLRLTPHLAQTLIKTAFGFDSDLH